MSEDGRKNDREDVGPVEDVTEECGNNEAEPEEEKRNIVAEFFSDKSVLAAAFGALFLIVVIAVLALVLNGSVFDKIAIIWAFAFILQFAVWKKISRKRANLVFAIIYGVLALAFLALYVLELTGILP